jgi:pyrroloquinoline quinone biosynthesis protein D
MSLVPLAKYVPAFASGVKFRHDPVRQVWVLLAPERLFLPDSLAVAVLQRIDGRHSQDAIVNDLAMQYQAPREVIATDVAAMLRDLADKNILRRKNE